jgi:lipopolysaccharide export system protein LptA
MTRNSRFIFRFTWYAALQVILFVVGIHFVHAQQKEDIVELEHADSLVGTEIDGEKARMYIGHVRLKHGSTLMTCERATQYLTSNKIAMEGVVEVKDDTMRLVTMHGMYFGDLKVIEGYERVLLEEPGTVLHAAYGRYFMDEKKAFFRGNVYVEDTASVLTSNELTYFREQQYSIADGTVKIVNRRNGLTIFGNHFENYKKLKYSKVTDQPKVMQIDTSSDGKKDTLIVTSKLMEAYQDSLERLIATDSVEITRSNLSAEAGLCTYYTDLDSIILLKSPYVWYQNDKNDDNQVSGESIYIKLLKHRLQTAYVRGHAVAISRADSIRTNRFNQMTGQEIILYFAHDKIQRLDVDVTATSLYYLFDKGKPNGMNKTTGDHVTMTFTDGKIDKITARTNVEGEYYPERLIDRKEADYNLPEFNWRENMPGKRPQKK